MSNLGAYAHIIKLQRKEDPFILLRKCFIDYAFCKTTKLVNMFCILFLSLELLFEICYLINNFELELLRRHSFEMTAALFAIGMMIYSIPLEPKIIHCSDVFFNMAWSIRSVCLEKRKIILNKTKMFHNGILVSLMLHIFSLVLITPIFGDLSNILLCIRMFDEYFQNWSKILNFFYFSMMPFIFYSGFRFCYSLLYSVLHARLQVAILNEHISRISNCYEHLSEEKKYTDSNYQKVVLERLKFCIDRHVALKKLLNLLLDIVRPCVPVFTVLGILVTMGMLTFFWENWDSQHDGSFIIRSCTAVLAIIIGLILFAEAGEGLIQETGLIFTELTNSAWDLWDANNKKISLVFMANALKPLEFSFAGVALNRQLVLSVLNKSLSLALFLYSMKDISH